MACTFLEWKSGLFSGDYWCAKKDCSVDTDTYYKYCRNYDYGDCPIYKKEDNSGCFITTIVCQILKHPDNNKLLNNFRCFRNNILQKNEKYYDILKQYDVIGSMIASAIYNDNNREEMANIIYNEALIFIDKLIKEGKYDIAVEKYFVTTLALINYYGLKREYNKIRDNGYNYDNFIPNISGHGMKKLKTLD